MIRTGPACIGMILVVLSILIIISLDSCRVFQTSAPVGVDGYYYVLQIDTLKETGMFYFPTSTPLVLYFLTLLSSCIGNTFLAIKIGSLLLELALFSGVAVLVGLLSKSFLFSAFAVFLASISVLHLYFLSEFISNFGGLALFVWSVICLVRYFQYKNKAWMVVAVILLMAACVSHKSLLGVTALVLLACAANYLTQWTFRNFKYGHLLTFLGLTILPPLLSYQPLFHLPDWFKAENVREIQLPAFSTLMIDWLMLLLTCATTILVATIKPGFFERNASVFVLMAAVFLSGFFFLNPFWNHNSGVNGLVGRLDLNIFLLVAISVPLLLSLVIELSKPLAFVLAALFGAVSLTHLAEPLPQALKDDSVQRREKLIQRLPDLRERICQRPIIIARHGDEFLVSATVGVPSQQKPPETNAFECIYWLVDHDGTQDLIGDSEIRSKFATMSRETKQVWISENPHLRELLQ